MNLFLHANASTVLDKSEQATNRLFNRIMICLLFLLPFFGQQVMAESNPNLIQDMCDDVTNGGTISGDETGCDDPVFDPSIIINATHASGGSNTLEYLWMSTTDDPFGVSAVWSIIPGSTSESYDPGPITQTTYYRRCAKRAGCTVWVQESNIVTKTVLCAPPCDLEIKNIIGINPKCNPGNTGIVALSIMGGTAPITYTWSNGDTTEDLQYLDAGTYCVTVTDANGCTVTDCVTLTAPDPLDASIVITPATCSSDNGALDLSVTGGNGSYTFLWSNGASTEDLSNLYAGTYCVTITDSEGCTISECYVVNEIDNGNVSITPSHSNICPGEYVSLTATGSTGSTYSWSATAGNLSSTSGQTVNYTMGMPGTYTITVSTTDANGCVSMADATVTVDTPPSITGTETSATCNEYNGSITTTASGTAPFTYSWNNGASTANISDLAAGQYCVTVTDANGCIVSACYNVSNVGVTPLTVAPSASSICPGETVTLTANGAAGSTYSWSSTAGNLSSTSGQSVNYTMGMPGTYTITVSATDANGCVSMADATVTVDTPPSITGTETPATCNESNGSITTTASGTAPFTYSWNNGATSANISHLAAGQYCVTVTDANGCKVSACYNVANVGVTPVTITPSASNICLGEMVNLTVNGAPGSIYTWSASAGNLSSTTGQSVGYTVFLAGTYTITVQSTDSNGCTTTTDATITVNSEPSISFDTIIRPTCGENNGILSITGSGTEPLMYSWNNGSTSQNLSNLAAGQYCVTVTDANGCIAVSCFGLNNIEVEPITITPNQTNVCPGETVVLTVNGAPGNTYSWSTSAGNLSSTTGESVNYTMGMPGTYTITVSATDANGCMTGSTAVVTVSAPPTVIGIRSNATCNSDNGFITTNVSGASPFTYAWSNGATTANISNLEEGQYCVTVTDVNGCLVSDCYQIEEIPVLPISITPSNSSICPGETLALTVDGAPGNTYTWFATAGNLSSTTGQNTNYTMGMPGTYTISVQAIDSNGCIAAASATVVVNPLPTLSLENTIPATCDEDNGTLAIIGNGAAPLTYNWSNGANTASIDNLAAGQYCVTITDVNGCSKSDCYDVQNLDGFTISDELENPTCFGSSNGNIFIEIFGGASPFSGIWDDGNTFINRQNLTAGDYCVTITDANGCSTSACYTLNNPTNFILNSEVENTICAENNGSISITPSGGNSPFSYTWNTGANTASISNLSPGQYCVTVEDDNGCFVSDCYTIQASDPVIVDFDVIDFTCSFDGAIATVVTSGLAPYTYLWNTNETTATIGTSASGQYCVTVTDANGCTGSKCTTISEPEEITIESHVIDPTCDLDNGSIAVSTSSAATFDWSTGATTSILDNIGEGTYSVTVTANATGCTTTATYTLESTGALAIALDPMNPICQGADNGMVVVTPWYSGSGTLTYTWNTGANTDKISDLAAGEYCVTVSSSDGCVESACTILTAPEPISANAVITSAGCNDNKGKVKLVPSGGTAPYSFIWNTGATTEKIVDLTAGTYCATITDAIGCVYESCYTVQGGVDFLVGVQTVDIDCHGNNNGVATASTNGGTAPFTYLWNTGASTSSIDGLAAGTYCVTVTDVFGCSTISCGDISEPNPLDIMAISSNTTCNENNGTASVSSLSPFTSVLWSNGSNMTNLSNLAPGDYGVVITDANGCTASSSVTVNPSSDIEVTVSPIQTTICPGESVDLTSMVNQSTGVTYTWSAVAGNLSSTASSYTTYTMMTPGTYTITLLVENTDGCMASDQATVTVLGANDPTCNPVDDSVNIGDFVWFDGNNNGIQDPNELGVSGIEVKLMTAGPDGIFYTADDITIDTEITNANGYYLFEDVAEGDYVIMFCLNLPDVEYTSQDTGGSDLLDSDANTNTGKTDPFTVVAGQEDDLSFDAGLILTPSGCSNITSGGEICCDQIICGAGGLADPITDVSLPTGGMGDIEYLWMSSTVGGPFDPNTWTMIPGADGPEYTPGGIFQTTFITRCARRAGCTTYLESNIIKLEVKPAPTTTITSLPAYICVGETDNFNAENAGIGASYLWDLGEGANPATSTDQYLTDVSWSTPGSKTITLTTTNAFCSVTITRMVEVGSCLNQGGNSNRFISLQATPMPEAMEIDLTWTTNEDMNDYYFTIEHSADGDNYEVIYSMDGNEAYQSKAYDYLDTNARPGRNYYRIQHINNNGRTERSEVVMTIIDDFAIDNFILFPNPTQDFVILESLKLEDQEGTIMVADMAGTILQELSIPANTTRHTVDISSYPPGNYVLYIKYLSARSKSIIVNKMEK